MVSPACAGNLAWRRLRLRAIAQQAREIDLDRRALAGLAVDLHVPVRLFDEPVDLAQPEAGALPGFLGSEEWFEGAAERFLIHAATGIGD